ncbi:MAG: hypothetical protein MnENMB40S_12200 [Rhizobiaceae bacterium MnEN-MB40S]|nr:MAG: hypothetical protein MnENMB40S_12200 [Rhizobiaceae bacterium MnEN-MB40S]
MHVSNTINCSGLSTAPTVLRIKQALIGLPDSKLPLSVLVDTACDCARLVSSLGAMAGDVYLASDVRQMPAHLASSRTVSARLTDTIHQAS